MGTCRHKMVIDKVEYQLNDNAKKLIQETLEGFTGTPQTAVVAVPSRLPGKLSQISAMLNPDKGMAKKKVQELIAILEA